MITYSELWGIQEPLLAMAAILQGYVLFSRRLERWKNATADWWVNLQLITWSRKHEISKRFLEIFNIVYGSRTFSIRRILTSFIFSIGFVVFFYWLLVQIAVSYFNIPTERYIGENPYFTFYGFTDVTIAWLNPLHIFILAFDSIWLNVVPDYVSLAETAWVFKLASEERLKLLYLIVIDLLLTTLVFAFFYAIGVIYTNYVIYGHDLSYIFHDFISKGVIPNFVFTSNLSSASPPANWAMLFTTYSTSIIWWCFLMAVFGISVAKRSSMVAVQLLESKWVSQLPIMLIVGIPCLLAWPILFILRWAA